MFSSSNLFKRTGISNGIYIKGNFKKGIARKYFISKVIKRLVGKQEAVVRDIFPTSAKKTQRAEVSYTIQKGDDKRINRNGILRVYNINEPIDIPVRQILGKWSKNFIGVTLVFAGDKWDIKGKLVA